jgi:proliferating cell nuclear antigen
MDAAGEQSHVFQIVSAQGGVIRGLFEILKDIVHDVSITVDESGFRILTMDGVRQMLMSLKLSADKFELFKIEGAGPHRLCVNVGALFKLLRVAGARDTVELYQEHRDREHIGIKISNDEKKTSTTFKMRLLDINFSEIKVPDQTFDATASMPSTYFQRLCRDMANIGNLLELGVSEDGNSLLLGCEGDFASQRTTIGSIEDGKHVVSIERFPRADDSPPPRLTGAYSLKYLSLFNKASSISPVVDLFFKHNYPLVLRFPISNLGFLQFALAQTT